MLALCVSKNNIAFYKAKEKEEARITEERKNKPKEKKPGFDGRWYTDIDGNKYVKPSRKVTVPWVRAHLSHGAQFAHDYMTL